MRVGFTSFEQAIQMLAQNQFERYVIDPVLKPWTGPLNHRIGY